MHPIYSFLIKRMRYSTPETAFPPLPSAGNVQFAYPIFPVLLIQQHEEDLGFGAFLGQLLESIVKAPPVLIHFGLHLSRRQGIGMLGDIGHVIQQAPDLRTALRQLSTYLGYHNQGATLTLKVEDNIASSLS